MKIHFVLLIILTLAPFSLQGAGPNSVLSSPHNLSTAGSGTIHATSEQQVCVFCHAPHKATAIQPLWNRGLSSAVYQVYTSNSLQAQPGQPTGSSKLCLSCHDGTIGLGNVTSRTQTIAMQGGVTVIPAGKTNLGTDLRNDHPISFVYDTTLVGKNAKLKNPGLLPSVVHLDQNQNVQCTSCHDAHNDSLGKFLVMDNSSSQLCNACHVMGTTTVPDHVQCSVCHQSHTSPSGPYLLKSAKISTTCLACHSGGTTPPQGVNIAAELAKTSTHDTSSAINLANPFPSNITCADCHEPHTMTTTAAVAPTVPARFGRIRGVNKSGTTVSTASYEYEVCFKCHADQSALTPWITRQIVQSNTRLEFDAAAISYHPVEAAGKNTNGPSLIAPLTTSSIIYCGDCHTSNSDHKAGGTGPNGAHGSTTRPLLMKRYDTADPTSESATVYALCYTCHNRTSILGDKSFTRHNTHISGARTPCATCHDAHGISASQGTATKNSRLINFNTTIVTASSGGRLEFNVISPGHGRCYLRCHGENHNPYTY